MTSIEGLAGSAAAPAPRRRQRAGAPGFAMPPEAPTDPAMAEAPMPAGSPFMDGLLGLQELGLQELGLQELGLQELGLQGLGPRESGLREQAPAVRDREARRHGQALLSALAEVQLSLVGAGGAAGSLLGLSERLTALADAVPVAADPRLRAVVAAIALRARLELARRPAEGNPVMSDR